MNGQPEAPLHPCEIFDPDRIKCMHQRSRMRTRNIVFHSTLFFMFALIVSTLVITHGLEAYAGDEAAQRSQSADDPLIHAVEKGDTLWQIARLYGDERVDPRKIIWEIKKANGLKTANIQIGMKLIIPHSVVPKSNK